MPGSRPRSRISPCSWMRSTRLAASKVYEEKASGAQRERPGLKAALGYMRQGDTLVVWKLDRLARSLKQLIETVEAMGEQGIGLRSLTEAIDTTTSGGKLVFHLFAALAEFERGVIRERTLAGLQAARARGAPAAGPLPLSPRTSPPPRPCCRTPGLPWSRSPGAWASCPRPSTAICPGRAPPPAHPELRSTELLECQIKLSCDGARSNLCRRNRLGLVQVVHRRDPSARRRAPIWLAEPRAWEVPVDPPGRAGRTTEPPPNRLSDRISSPMTRVGFSCGTRRQRPRLCTLLVNNRPLFSWFVDVCTRCERGSLLNGYAFRLLYAWR